MKHHWICKCVMAVVMLSGTSQADIVAAFTTYVEQNQALNHFPAGILAISAFIQTFPCDEAGQP